MKAAAILALTLVVGCASISSSPAPTSETPSPSAAAAVPSPEEPLELVAYDVMQPVEPLPETCTGSIFHPGCRERRIWVANTDGTDAHELFPSIPGFQYIVAWSPDGASLLYGDDSGLVLTDLAGSNPQRLPFGDMGDSVDFSPDGTRLALAYASSGDQGLTSTIAIYDLATRQLTEIESIRTHFDPDTDCTSAAQEGTNSSPRWSPDGTRLLVSRGGMWPKDDSGNCTSIVFSIKPDGSDFRLVVPNDGRIEPANAKWSPDGSRILFPAFTFSGPGDAEGACNIYVVRPDGSDLRALTDDGVSCWPHWTRDGRLVFRRWLDEQRNTYDLWITDTDGNQARLSDTSIAALTSVGCVVCPSPQDANFGDTNGGTGGDVLWQPTP